MLKKQISFSFSEGFEGTKRGKGEEGGGDWGLGDAEEGGEGGGGSGEEEGDMEGEGLGGGGEG